MTASRASKSASTPAAARPERGDHGARIEALEQRLAVAEQALRVVVEELKTRKVIPAVTTARGPKRVRMSPEARRAQRQKLLADARTRRWPDKVKTPVVAKPKRPR